MAVKVSSNYHSQKRGDYYVVEPDGSLEPDDKSQETGLEIVSPPMPLNQAIEQLQKVIEWANDPNEGNAYTNSSTGLHMGISIPYKGGDVDYLKLILFMGDKYVLDKFGRAANTYTASAMEKLKQNVAGSRNRDDNKITSAVELMKNNLLELAQRYVQQGVGNAKYTSAHIKDGYIEFRSPGGDYLAKANEEINVLEDTMRRFAYAMYLAGRPDLERAEYYKKLYKLIAPEGSKDLELFSKFSAGEITADQLKKQWAEKVIAKEVPSTDKKSNWRLYNRSTDKPVQGLEFSNYTELDAVERAKARVSPASSMTDFNLTYELRDIGTNTGRWNIVQQDTDETLEIVDAATRNEAVDYAHDKYSGGPDNVNFYVIPYTGNQESEPKPKLSRRAELATQIAQPKDYVIVNKHSLLPFYTFRASTMSQAVDFAVTYLQDKNLDVGNFTVQRASNVKQAVDNAVDSRRLQQRVQATDQYEIVDRRSQQVVLRYRADDAADAGDKFSNWLRNQGMPIDTENYGYRPDASEAFERNSDRIDAIRGRASTNPNPTVQDPNQVRMPNYYDPRGIPVWELFDRETGSVLHTIADHTEREAHQEAMAWLRSYGAEDPSTYEERFGVRAKMLQPGERNLGESIDDAQKARNAMDAAAKKLGYANFAAVPQSAKNSVMQLAVNALKLGSGHYNMLDKKNKK
jgi:septum formation topological specificity factor MinE